MRGRLSLTHLEDLEDYHLSADAVARIRRGDVILPSNSGHAAK